jgi:hypothetical protein
MSFWQKINLVWKALNVDCREASRAQSEMLDHPLPPVQSAGVRLHTLMCGWCRRYGQQIRFLHNSTRGHAEKLSEATPQSLSGDARERIKKRLRDGK